MCDEEGALLVLDEMMTGFRWDARGAQSVYGIRPDLSSFGKGTRETDSRSRPSSAGAT